MSEVKLSIGGRLHTISCAEGEEAHVAALGETIDAKLQQLGSSGSTPESQKLLFGALMLADELHDAREAATNAAAEMSATSKLDKGEDLKAEVERLQNEAEELRGSKLAQDEELGTLRRQVEEQRNDARHAAEMSIRLAELEQERSRLTAQIASKDTLLERANGHMNDLKAELASASNGNDTPTAAILNDPAVALSLERFADLLENCADKLESKTASA